MSLAPVSLILTNIR